MPKPLPPLELLREYLAFSPEGVITVRKRTNYGDRRPIGSVAGTHHREGYIQVQFFGILYLAHRLVFYEKHGWCPPIIDHIDGDGTNNRPDNMRPATKAQNRANGRKSILAKPTSSKLRGAIWHKGARKWMSAIYSKKKTKYLGLFETEIEAHQAFCKAARDIYGEYFKP